MVIVFALVALAVLAVVAGLHRYVWRRLVRDTTRGPGPARRVGTALFVTGPVLTAGALVAERTGAPFWLQRSLAWPGFLWLALALYLLLGVLAAEAVRPLLNRLSRRVPPSPRDAVASPSGRPSSDAAVSPSDRPSPDPAGSPSDRPSPDPVASASDRPIRDRVASASDRPIRDRVASAPDRPSPDAAVSPSGRPSPDPVASPLGRPSRVVGGQGPGVQGAEPPGAVTEAPAQAPAPPAPAQAPAPERAPEPGVPEPTRRLVVSRLLAGAVTTAAVATVGHGTYGVLQGPRVRRVTVPLAKLPRAANGFRIAVVSDIHLGPVLGRGFAQRVVDTVNATQPDLIAVVGDLVDGSVKDLGPAAAPLARLSARHGAYFVTGNHEYFSGAEQWIAEVRDLGLHPLQNARTELPYFDLAGVNDVQGESEGQGPDFAKALDDRDPARACVLLAHQPVQIHEAVRHGVDLQLSGHTHGGQLWPGSLLAAAANPTVAGLDRYGDTQLYVSRGAGAWGPPTRVGAPSDVTVIELAATRA
ncbi:metallophosphoesterase [Streptomyces sp. MC1]|uniref:metallophosphoesterase n=1 Tax=Streptomyces sp. MC1 TaxID=295105 RepID=UPI0018CB0F3C|nr:metallophosphoesterase [Streptomyces sp. MC1]MBG7700576.1 metallophosphoesterase [Streptomyces sp. MC1]